MKAICILGNHKRISQPEINIRLQRAIGGVYIPHHAVELKIREIQIYRIRTSIASIAGSCKGATCFIGLVYKFIYDVQLIASAWETNVQRDTKNRGKATAIIFIDQVINV